MGGPNNMSQHSGNGSNSSSYTLGRASNNHRYNGRGGSSSYPFTALSPARADLQSRRRSMTVQDMLNPSDEEPRRSSQLRLSPPSSDTDSSQEHLRRSFSISHSGRSTPRGQSARAIGRKPYGDRRHRSRRSSPSSSSSEGGDRERRGLRIEYTPEQTRFIWYLRIDCGYLWPDLKDAFNSRFSQSRAVSGLQCRYYRLIEQNHMPQVRNMTRTADNIQKYGMRATLTRAGADVDYPWLNGEYAAKAYGQILQEKKSGETSSR